MLFRKINDREFFAKEVVIQIIFFGTICVFLEVLFPKNVLVTAHGPLSTARRLLIFKSSFAIIDMHTSSNTHYLLVVTWTFLQNHFGTGSSNASS